MSFCSVNLRPMCVCTGLSRDTPVPMSYAGIFYVRHALCSRMEARLLVTMHHRMRAPHTRLSRHASHRQCSHINTHLKGTHTLTHAYIRTDTRTCTHTHTHIHIHTHTYTHTHTHTLKQTQTHAILAIPVEWVM